MPSHFTHLLFAEEALRLAFGDAAETMLGTHGNLFRFGAQGPDFFYHNQRTMPTGLRYGVALHRRGYGDMVEAMAKEALRLAAGPGSELSAYILGFATHAPLDRRTHPFINYFAGWFDPKVEATRRLRLCHPFLERILDVLAVRERLGTRIDDFDYLSRVRCGKTLPYPVLKALVKGLHAVYPSYNYKSKDRQRVENAYYDTMFFYKLTNHLNPDILKLAFRKDRKEGFKERRLALLHPRAIPGDCDFLNAGRSRWCHPCDDSAVSTAGFMDLYEEALAETVPMLKDLMAVLAGRAPLQGLGARVGNQSLDTGREHCAPVHSRPLPLPEILDAMYGMMEKAHTAGPRA
jgi:hypothetical protein